MKIIDAFWEKRNLGVTTVEIKLEANDDISCLEQAIIDKAEYAVVKVGGARLDFSERLAQLGFIFVENMFTLEHNLKIAPLDNLSARMDSCVSYSLMNNQDYEHMFKQIRQNIFKSDRVYLDRHFTQAQAAERYVNWITDEIDRGTEIYNILYKSNRIGFFTLKEVEKAVYLPLFTGIYNDSPNVGIGLIAFRKSLQLIEQKGGKKSFTYISSNNIAALKNSLSLGYKISLCESVFVRHNNI